MAEGIENSSSFLRRFWPASRRGWILVGIVGFLLLVRITLPTIVQKVIVSQGNEYLEGEVSVGDVDLWLLSGAVALEDVALWPDGAAPKEGETPNDTALVAWKRAYVNIRWMPLLSKIANIEDFELDELSVNVARLQDGTLVIPDLRDLPEEEEEEPEDDSEPFGVLIDRAALLSARLRVRDDVPGKPTYRELELPSVEVKGLAINDPEATAPGRIVVQASLGDGTLRIDTNISERDDGFLTEAQIDIANLPLDQLHVHEPSLGWTGSKGRLETSVHLTVDPQARILVSGNVAVSGLSIDVRGEQKPGLAWRRLGVKIDQIDVAQQRVDLELISLDGANVLLRPMQQPPLPVMPPAAMIESADTTNAVGPTDEEPAPAATDEPDTHAVATADVVASTEPSAEATSEITGADLESTAVDVGETTAVTSNTAEQSEGIAVEPPAGPADDAPPTDWTIAVATVEITDSGADIVADRRPGHAHIGKLTVTGIDATPTTWKVGSVDLVDGSAKASLRTGDTHIEIPTLTVTGLTSNPASPLKIVGRIKEDSAVIDVDADVVLEPQSVQAKLNLENVALGRYADLSGMSPVHMPTGTLQAALAIDVAGDDANLSGQIALEDLQVLTQDGKQDFAVAWETLAIDIRSFHANVAEPEAPMSLELADFHLTGPKIRATLTADGIVLPTVRVDAAAAGALAEDSGAPAAGEPELQDASATETADADQPHDAVIRSGLVAQTEAVGVDEIAKFAEPAANLPIGLVVDRLRIQNGEFRVVDRAVKPTYRGKVTDFHFDISGVALPADVPPSETVFEKMSLDLRAPGDALVKVRAGTAAQGVRIDANVEKLPLSQFNPYVQQAAGYTVLAGAATVESTVLWAKDRYDSDTDITLSALDVGNAKGGSLFKDYFGISISAALALLSDITGKIDLGIPVSGTTEGTEIGIGSVVEQALTKAILGAIMSPLKMLGAITMIGGKVAEITPSPVSFRAGSDEISKDAQDKVERVSSVLSSSPAIKIELVGQAGSDDVRGLKEAAVLAALAGESGFLGGLRNLASGGTRKAIRKALQDDDVASLNKDDAAELDEMVAEKSVTDADLTALANRRAERLFKIFTEDDGVPADQVSVGEPIVTRDEDGSQVAVNLLARA
ncbi:MAG: DUF748 domain-containing protein [Candidatus Binatia bacterium]|nr:DUF748 domain-containing protein [Candidatus Binatia bacterium]